MVGGNDDHPDIYRNLEEGVGPQLQQLLNCVFNCIILYGVRVS